MKKLIFILIFSLLLITPCSAAPYDDASLQNSLPDYARDLAGEVSQPANEGLEQIESALTETLSGGLSGLFKNAAACNVCSVRGMRNPILCNGKLRSVGAVFGFIFDNSP